MKLLFHLKIISFACVLLLSSCKKDDILIIDDNTITGEIQLNTLFNLIEIKNGFLLSGINDSKITISKLDVNFGTIWKKDNYEWGTTFSEGGWGGAFYSVEVKKIFLDEKGNFICFCSIEEGGDVIWSSVLIVKLDKYGKEINRIEIDNTVIINVTKTNDNGYMLFGNKLIKLKPDLSQAWENNDQNYAFSGAYIIPTNDNGLATTGTWNSEQVFLQKFDERGILQWTKRDYNKEPFNDLGYDLFQMANGGFLIIGRTRDLIPPWDMNCFIIRTDIAGDTIWTKKFGEESNEWLENFLFASEDYYIIKETVGYPNDAIHKTILLRITADGQIVDSKEIDNFEKLLYTSSGYFVKAEKTGNNIIMLSKVQINDLVSK
jgi:hypothetical protein